MFQIQSEDVLQLSFRYAAEFIQYSYRKYNLMEVSFVYLE